MLHPADLLPYDNRFEMEELEREVLLDAVEDILIDAQGRVSSDLGPAVTYRSITPHARPHLGTIGDKTISIRPRYWFQGRRYPSFEPWARRIMREHDNRGQRASLNPQVLVHAEAELDFWRTAVTNYPGYGRAHVRDLEKVIPQIKRRIASPL